ncbi:MAG: hypothetical protein PVH88_15535 [Ignavibacteria bacterium]|jgi:hypothetical protein
MLLKKYLFASCIVFVIIFSSCQQFYQFIIINNNNYREDYLFTDNKYDISYEFFGEYSWVDKNRIHTAFTVKINNDTDNIIRIRRGKIELLSNYFTFRENYEKEVLVKQHSELVFTIEFYGPKTISDKEFDFLLPNDAEFTLKLKEVSIDSSLLYIENIHFIPKSSLSSEIGKTKIN